MRIVSQSKKEMAEAHPIILAWENEPQKRNRAPQNWHSKKSNSLTTGNLRIDNQQTKNFISRRLSHSLKTIVHTF